MVVHMRNKASGEIRDVEADSVEFRKLQREVTSLGQPMWEQTNYAHADSIRRRAASGALLEEDLGYEDADQLRFAALELADEGVAPEENPHLYLTPGEIEAGLTPQQKQKDLRDMFNARRGRRSEVWQGASERIAGDDYVGPDEEPALRHHEAMTALAGGSDDRENAPPRGASATSNAGDDEGQTQPSTGGPGGSRQSGARRKASGGSESRTEGQGSSQASSGAGITGAPSSGGGGAQGGGQ